MSKKSARVALLVLGTVFLAIQLIPVDQSNPPARSELAAPLEVAAVLRRACYDCHSHETVWPAYARVAPVSWLISHDVQEGREELNFSIWSEDTSKKQAEKRKEIAEETAEGNMPLWYYVTLHPEARLSNDEQRLIRSWLSASEPSPVTLMR
jgi:cytochrome c551/c552